MNQFPLTEVCVKHTLKTTTRHAVYALVVLFGMATQIAGAASLRRTHEHDAPPVTSERGDRKMESFVLAIKAAAQGHYTFEQHAAGPDFLPAQSQSIFIKVVTYQPHSDRLLRSDITSFAAAVAAPAPDVAPVAITALGLLGVMWRSRFKSPKP